MVLTNLISDELRARLCALIVEHASCGCHVADGTLRQCERCRLLQLLNAPVEPTREPLPTCAERVSDLRLTEIQRSFIMALDKGDPNYMVSLEWNEGLSILNELKFKRVTENRGAPR